MLLNILKIMVIAIGLIIIVHLLIRILIVNQRPSSSSILRRNNSLQNSHSLQIESMEPQPINNIPPSFENGGGGGGCGGNGNGDGGDLNLEDIGNELKDWMATNATFQEGNGMEMSSSLDNIFRQTEVKAKDTIQQIPLPSEEIMYQFATGSVSTPVRNDLPKPINVADEPMSWTTAFVTDTTCGGGHGGMNQLKAWSDNNGLSKF